MIEITDTNVLLEELKNKEKSTIQKQGQIKVDMKRITDAEEQENKVIDTLASQVRDSLAKVRMINACLSVNIVYYFF